VHIAYGSLNKDGIFIKFVFQSFGSLGRNFQHEKTNYKKPDLMSTAS